MLIYRQGGEQVRNSYEIAKFIEKKLKELNMKPAEYARRVGVDRSTISRYFSGTRKINMDELPAFAEALGLRPEDLLFKDEELKKIKNITPITSEAVKVPILGEIACGNPIYVAENFEGYIYEYSENLPSGNVFVLISKGDSMEPTISDGSYVLIREQPDVDNGDIAAVLINDDTEATLKRVRKQNGNVILVSDNPKYEPILITENNPARIIGKAIRVSKRL